MPYYSHSEEQKECDRTGNVRQEAVNLSMSLEEKRMSRVELRRNTHEFNMQGCARPKLPQPPPVAVEVQ